MINNAQALAAVGPVTGRRIFAIDTAIVVFLLGVDFGQRFTFGVECLLTGSTLVMFTVFPYFLPSDVERPRFASWLLGRMAIASLAVVAGMIFGRSIGIVLPEIFRFLPLALLIVAGIASFYLQLYNLLKLRPAR